MRADFRIRSADGGTLTVGRDRFRGEEYAMLRVVPPAGLVSLTAGQARAVARELMTEADALDVPLPGSGRM
jgi:hypothetical protein